MDVPPPLRRPVFRKRRAVAVGLGAAVLGFGLAGMMGHADGTDCCKVCNSTRQATEIGVYWQGEPLLAGRVPRQTTESSAYADTLSLWGHTHRWETSTDPPRLLIPGLGRAPVRLTRVMERGSRLDPTLNWASWLFVSDPAIRLKIRDLVREGSITPPEVEDALAAWCEEFRDSLRLEDAAEDPDAPRRRAAAEKLRPIFGDIRTHIKGRRRSLSPPAGDGER